MINWKNLKNSIPSHIKIKKVEYEILYTDDFKDGKTLGETRLDAKQILLKTNESDKETFHTYVHELLHAVSEEYRVGLTEKQVRALEKSLQDWIKPANILNRSINETKQRKR